jgi:DNA-binding CsgD family transcriptional regulator
MIPAHSIETQRRLCVAILSGNSARRADLSAVIRGAGHRIAAVADADVVVVDGALSVPEHPAVIRLADVDDGESAGKLPQAASAMQILAAIQALAAGLSVRARGAEGGFGPAPEPRSATLLTPREMEILDALSQGLTNKAIARKLDISLHTVKFHIESLYRKLQVRSRAQAVMKGLMTQSRIDL